jgi:putative FmdB family regulatory protein
MPIYAYKCSSCGHAKDVLQKISDAPLSECPACGAQTFSKQVTAAGFQLKGSGWYVTDFRGGNSATGATGTEPKTSSAGSASTTESSGAASASSTAAPAVAASSSGSVASTSGSKD